MILSWPPRLLRWVVITKEMTPARVTIGQAFEISNNAAFGQGSFVDAAVESRRMRVHFYDNLLSLWGTLGWWALRCRLHRHLRAEPGARAVTDQVAGRSVHHHQPAGDDALLRHGDRAG